MARREWNDGAKELIADKLRDLHSDWDLPFEHEIYSYSLSLRFGQVDHERLRKWLLDMVKRFKRADRKGALLNLIADLEHHTHKAPEPKAGFFDTTVGKNYELRLDCLLAKARAPPRRRGVQKLIHRCTLNDEKGCRWRCRTTT